jgi:arylsulfatase
MNETRCGNSVLTLAGVALLFPCSFCHFAPARATDMTDSGPVTAKPGSPNILLILLDDVGFADTSTFGGFALTPALDRLAAEGLRYLRFHTAGTCSPTRAALLAGRNQHRLGWGAFGGVGYPGYDGIWSKDVVAVAEVLRRNGYSTAAIGKWHNTNYDEISPIGPFERWPTGLGFEFFYGNMLGLSSQWEPPLWRNTQMVAPPAAANGRYHFTTDITNESIRWIETHNSLAPDKPWFLFFAPAAAHGPHHVPAEWIRQYRGRFDAGWDQLRREVFKRQKRLGVIPSDAPLTRRPAQLPAWESLSIDQRTLFARQMEVFAAFITHTDHEIGRLLEAVKRSPHALNTMVVFIVGDNGGEAGLGIPDSQAARDTLPDLEELGGPRHINYHAAGWAWMGNTPFPWFKHVASHLGATRNPLVVSWPARIRDRGGVRLQFSHVNDIAATLFEAAAIRFPTVIDGIPQMPLDGVTLVPSFDRADAPSLHRMQYFESQGSRAIYEDDWMASARHSVPWLAMERERAGAADFDHDSWELYHLTTDFSQAHDVARRYPAKLEALKALFDAQARANDVYPLGAGSVTRAYPWSEGSHTFTYRAGFPTTYRFPGSRTRRPGEVWGWNFSMLRRITATVDVPATGAKGVIVAWGSRVGGIAFYVKDDRLVLENNIASRRREIITSTRPLPKGRVELAVDYQPTDSKGASFARLYIDGTEVGGGAISANVIHLPYGVFDIGRNSVSPVSDSYAVPFEFTGGLDSVTVETRAAPEIVAP